MNATSDRKIIVALFIIFALCLVGAAVCIYRGEAGNMQLLQAQLQTDQKKLADVKEKINHLPQLEIEFAQLQQRLNFLEKPLPDVAYIPTFLQQIEKLAISTNNQIVTISPKKKLAKAGAKASGGLKMNNETGEVVQEEEQTANKDEKKDEGKQESAKQELPYDFIPIELKIEGTYWTTLEFLKKLQRFPKMIAVNTVSFSPRASLVESDTRSPAMTINLELTAVVTKGAKDGKS